jgi:hypothetical protein
MENVGSEMWEISGKRQKYGKYGVGTCPLFEKRTGVFEINVSAKNRKKENCKNLSAFRFPRP